MQVVTGLCWGAQAVFINRLMLEGFWIDPAYRALRRSSTFGHAVRIFAFWRVFWGASPMLSLQLSIVFQTE